MSTKIICTIASNALEFCKNSGEIIDLGIYGIDLELLVAALFVHLHSRGRKCNLRKVECGMVRRLLVLRRGGGSP